MQQTVSLSNFDNRHSLITSEDDFSDDSLENASANANETPERDTSTQIIEIKLESKEVAAGEVVEEEEQSELSPPSPEPPQMPALSLPLKCSPGIAWEIKMDDNTANDINVSKVCIPAVLAIPPNFADCENSVASTPCNSILSTDHSYSSDWPDPPENPICSTEDEAGSIITDSGNDFFVFFFFAPT